MLLQNGGARLINFFAQMVLARLLMPADFGDIAIVSSLAALMATLTGFGVDDLILSRARRIDVWIAQAFWVSLIFSIAGAGVLVAFAPLCGAVFHSRVLPGLLAVLASSFPLTAFATVPNARLRADLRFRFLASYATAELLLTQALTILLAWRGFGAFSFVMPVPIIAGLRAFVYRRVTKAPVQRRIRRWPLKVLLRGGSALLGQKALTALRENGDYLLLGIVARKSEVGFYFLAFKLAAVPVYTLAGSLYSVLFPALAQLRTEPARQLAAAVGASRTLALIVIPLSFLQAAIAGSFLRVFFGEKWVPAAAMLSILTIGLAFDVIPCVAGALMTANGKFKAQWQWSLASIPVFFGFIGWGWLRLGTLGVALGVAAFFVLSAPGYSYFALHRFGCSLRDVAKIYLLPTLCSAAAIGLGLSMARVSQVRGHDLPMIAVIALFSVVAYFTAIRWISPAVMREALEKFSMLWGRTA